MQEVTRKKKKHEKNGSHLGTFPFWNQSSLHFSVEKNKKKAFPGLFQAQGAGSCVWFGVGIPAWPHDRIVFQETERLL